MIKKIILFILIATTGVIGIRKMNQPTGATTVDLIVNHKVVEKEVRDDFVIQTDEINDVLIGTQQDAAVLPGREDILSGMFVNNYYREHVEGALTNKVVVKSSETTVDYYYPMDITEPIVFILDSNDRLFSHAAVLLGSTISSDNINSVLNEISTPPGYVHDTNLYYGDDVVFIPDVTPINETMVLRLKCVSDPSYRTYQVAVNGDTATVKTQEGTAADVADVLFDRQTTVTSTFEYFRYWMVGDEIVSYESEYTFSVYSDMIVKEVVGTELDDPVVAEPVINMYHVEANDDMCDFSVCGFELPAGYTAIESGMLFGGETYDTATNKVTAESISSDNEFAVCYIGDNGSVHTAYLVYKNSANEVNVIYDNGYGYEQMYLGDAVGSIEGINTAITSSYAAIDAEGGDVYGETGVDGIKMGTTTNPGVLCFTLPDGKFTDKVVVNAKAYDAIDEKTMTINETNSINTLTDEFEYYTIDLDESSNEVNFDTGMGETRFYINSVEIYYEDRGVEVVERNCNTALYAIEIGEEDTIIDTTALPTESLGYNIVWTLNGTTITDLDSSNFFVNQTMDHNEDIVASIDGTAYSRTINLTSIATDTTKNNITSWMGTQPGFDDSNNVTEDLVLPSEYSAYNSTISITNWTSNDSAIVIDGNAGMITRSASDTTVILTYDFTIAGISYTGQSTLIVKQIVAPAFLTYDFTTVTGASNKIDTNEEMKTVLDGINATVNEAELTSITDVNEYIYTGVDNYAKISCLKFSSTSVDGVFTMNFSATTTITRVVVTGCGWTSSTNTLTIGAVTNTFTNAVAWDAGGDTSNYNIQEYEYDIVDASSITFQADNRVLVTRIDIYTL